ncbi:MAG: hypothetical protein O2853_00025 [Proteobacteria bacterium]|mgnify:FL=1|jgi:hypothetical protein|nr:hypothetical protein [Pseudomonadota bacterium]MDA8668030.1 hypothetical protein [Alphaproteobacteria bacterium]
MKLFSIFILFIPNFLYAEILDKFSLACICDKSINALKYFDCKQKVSGTQLDILENKSEIQVYSSFDEKIYKANTASSEELNLLYETEEYISSMIIDSNLSMDFSINYKAYNKIWSYDLKCVSLKKE